MRFNRIYRCLVFVMLFSASCSTVASEISVYEIIYNEQELGTDTYKVRFVISDEYIRIDDIDDSDGEEDSGYILYDNNKRTIYSVSHFDKSILVIPYYRYKRSDIDSQVSVNYSAMPGAPKISGKTVFNYTADAAADKCMDIQLVPGLLPEVTKILKAYQRNVAGQQAKVLKTTPAEYQTTCFLYDQVYNEGLYYEKGLPIQEWHSNGRQRALVSYKKIKVDSGMYELPSDYREYSLD